MALSSQQPQRRVALAVLGLVSAALGGALCGSLAEIVASSVGKAPLRAVWIYAALEGAIGGALFGILLYWLFLGSLAMRILVRALPLFTAAAALGGLAAAIRGGFEYFAVPALVAAACLIVRERAFAAGVAV